MVDEGMIPGVVYDQVGKSTPIKIPANEVEILLSEIEGTPLLSITVDKKDEHIALLKEVQVDYRRNRVHHVSFMALDPKKEAAFDIEIIPKGESPAVKNNIGVLIFTRNSIELRGLPGDIPSHLEADIAKLEEVGDAINVSDLNIPESLNFINEEVKDYAVASIRPFQKTLEEEQEEEKEEEALEGEGLEEMEGEAGEEAPAGEEPPAEGEPEASEEETPPQEA